MPIQSHAALSLALSQALEHKTPEEQQAFYQKLCFGYASTWVEAYLLGQLTPFYARLKGVLNESSEKRIKFYQQMAKHQQTVFPEHRVQDFMKTTDHADILRRVFRFTACYQADDFMDFVGVFQSALGYAQCSLACMLQCKNHCSVLAFKQDKIWLCDVNHPHEPLIYDGTTEKGKTALVRQLMILMHDTSSTYRVITCECFAQSQDLALINPIFKALENNADWLKTQAITREKLWGEEGLGKKWVSRAILSADHPCLIRLLEKDQAFTQQILSDHQSLAEAILTGNLETCRILLKYGANCRAKDAQGRTALHRAVLHFEPEMLKYFIEQDPGSENESYQGMSAFAYALKLFPQGAWQTVRYQAILEIFKVQASLPSEKMVLWAAPSRPFTENKVLASMKLK